MYKKKVIEKENRERKTSAIFDDTFAIFFFREILGQKCGFLTKNKDNKIRTDTKISTFKNATSKNEEIKTRKDRTRTKPDLADHVQLLIWSFLIHSKFYFCGYVL